MARVLSAVDYTACSPPSTIPRVAMSIRALAVVLVWATAAGFVVAPTRRAVRPVTRPATRMAAEGGFLDGLTTSISVFQRSMAEGDDFKQSVANALAGEYDRGAARAKIEEIVGAAPLVVFSWDASPFSQKALKALAMTGAEVKNVGLDDPWAEGHPLRAELGHMTGRTSVPSVWIGGEYCGGYDDGPSGDAPGLMTLAFQGTLLPKLEAAGAMKRSGGSAPAAEAPVPDEVAAGSA